MKAALECYLKEKRYWIREKSKTQNHFIRLATFPHYIIGYSPEFTQTYLAFRSVCTDSNLILQLEIRSHLRNTQINLAFHSVCTNFAPENEVDRFELLATTVKNAKIHGVRCMHSLDYPRFI